MKGFDVIFTSYLYTTGMPFVNVCWFLINASR